MEGFSQFTPKHRPLRRFFSLLYVCYRGCRREQLRPTLPSRFGQSRNDTLKLMETLPEPWLRGPIPGVHALIAPVLYSFQQASEDIAKHTEGLTSKQIWATPFGFGSVGFHIRHIAGSVDRLTTYLEGKQLSEAVLLTEKEPGATREELLAGMQAAFHRAELVVRAIDPARLPEPREVGRKRLPTTVAALLTHIAEHTQRHVGQAVSPAKWCELRCRDRIPGVECDGAPSSRGGPAWYNSHSALHALSAIEKRWQEKQKTLVPGQVTRHRANRSDPQCCIAALLCYSTPA